MADDYYDLLHEIDLFSSLDRKTLELIGSITTQVDRPAGTVLIREGAPGQEAFVVMDGEASVTRDGKEIATVGTGGFFGEMALVDNEPRVATVTSTTPMRLLVLNQREFNTLLDQVPDVTKQILTGVQERLRQLGGSGS